MKRTKQAWRDSVDADVKYQVARAEAQAAANADGFDRGLERNDIFKSFSYRILPQRENRYGHETLCEVVMCEIMSKRQPGHGPR